MKFILGYMPGTIKPGTNRPYIYTELSCSHQGADFHLERFVRTDTGLCLPELRVYDAGDYPDDMIKNLLAESKIVPVGQ
jgi:hypothetical protein